MRFYLNNLKNQLIIIASLFFMFSAMIYARKEDEGELPDGCESFAITQGNLANATVVLFAEKIFNEALSAACAYAIMMAFESFKHPIMLFGIANVSTDQAVERWRVGKSLLGINYGRELLPEYQTLNVNRDGDSLPSEGRRSWESGADWYHFKNIIEDALEREMRAHIDYLINNIFQGKSDRFKATILEEKKEKGIMIANLRINAQLKKYGYPEITDDQALAISKNIIHHVLRCYKNEKHCMLRKDNIFESYFNLFFATERSSNHDIFIPGEYFPAAEECKSARYMDLSECHLRVRGGELFDGRVENLRSELDGLLSKHPSISAFFFSEKTIANRAVSKLIEQNNNKQVKGLVVIGQKV